VKEDPASWKEQEISPPRGRGMSPKLLPNTLPMTVKDGVSVAEVPRLRSVRCAPSPTTALVDKTKSISSELGRSYFLSTISQQMKGLAHGVGVMKSQMEGQCVTLD